LTFPSLSTFQRVQMIMKSLSLVGFRTLGVLLTLIRAFFPLFGCETFFCLAGAVYIPTAHPAFCLDAYFSTSPDSSLARLSFLHGVQLSHGSFRHSRDMSMFVPSFQILLDSFQKLSSLNTSLFPSSATFVPLVPLQTLLPPRPFNRQ